MALEDGEIPLPAEVEGTSLRSFSLTLLIGKNEGKRKMLKTSTKRMQLENKTLKR